MDRLDELNNFIKEADQVPEALEMDGIRRRTQKRANLHRCASLGRGLAVFLLVFIGGLTIGVNSSTAFASAVMDLPIIGNLAEKVHFNRSMEEAVENSYGTPVGIELKGNQYDLSIDYAMADDRSLVLFFRTDDNGGQNNMEMEVESAIDSDTGLEIPASYACPIFSSDGKYGMLRYEWEGYCENVSMDLKVAVYKGDVFQGSLVEEESYHLDLPVPAKSEANVYEINKTFKVDEAEYRIRQVRMYPLSTEIDVEYLNYDEVLTQNMYFTLQDENGNTVERNADGTVSYGDVEGVYHIVLESGYYNLTGDITLLLDSVELLTAERQEVTFDLDTLTFSDADGQVAELSTAKKNSYGEYEFSLTCQKDWQEALLFDSYLDEDGESQFCRIAKLGDNNYAFSLDDFNIGQNRQIELVRSFPDKVVDANLKFDLEN